MTAISAPGLPKLPVWQTVYASYVIVARNLGQLLRICWLWTLIMIPVYAGLEWLDETWSGESGAQATYRWIRVIAAALLSLVGLSFVASIAVAWHRLVLREERVTQLAYLRLDGVVWRYVLYAFVFLLPERGTLAICGLLVQKLAIEADYFTRLLIESLTTATAAGASIAISLLVLPRLALVMPATALGDRLSLRHAWRITQGNTLRLGMATALCMLPAVILAMLALLLWDLAIEFSQSLAYTAIVVLSYPVLTILGVTVLSLTYRFFAAPSRPPTLA